MKIYSEELKKIKLIDVFEIVLSGEWGEENLEDNENTAYIIRTTNFLNDGTLDVENRELVKRKISREKIDEKYLKRGDIIIEKSGGSPNQPVGRVVYFDIESEKNFLCNNFTSVLRVKEGIEPKYIFYFLKDCYKKRIVLKYQNKTTGIINLKLQDYLKNTEIQLPNIEIQNKIVEILDKAFLINSLLIEKERRISELNKCLFIKMFGDPLKENKNWQFKKISEIGTIISGSTPKTNFKEYWGGNNFWLTPAEMKDDTFMINKTERTITDLGVKSCSLIKMPKGTVILSSRAPIGKVGILETEMYCNQGFKNIIPREEINSVYLYYIFKLKKDYLNSLGRGATFKEISKGIVEKIFIKVPPIKLQNQFAERVKLIEKSKFELFRGVA